MAPLIDREKRDEARQGRRDRRTAIIGAARRVFADHPYGHTTLAAVGRMAGVPDGAADLLFASKAELFLEVLGDALNACCGDLVTELRRHGTIEPPELAAPVARALARHTLFTRLAGQLPDAVESVSDTTILWRFGNRVRDHLAALRSEIDRCCPSLGPGRGRALLMWLFVLSVGIEPLAHANAGMAAALIDPALRDFAVDFETEMRSMLSALLR